MKSASAMYVCGMAMLATGAMAHSMDMRKVGFRETGGAHVENGTETPEGQFVIDSAAKFYKTGDGTLKMTLSSIDAQVDYSMAALGGTLELAADADGPEEETAAPDVCRDAAFWVTPDSTVVTGGAFVARWCDVREPEATRALGATPAYVFAEPRWYHPTEGNDGVPPEKVTKHGREAVYFGGHLAGRYLQWSKVVDKIQAIFLVHGVYDTFGAAIGYSRRIRSGGFVPDAKAASTRPYADITKYFETRGDLAADLFSATAFLDGQALDVMNTKPIRGFQLLECHFAPIVTKADTFFHTRSETMYSDTNMDSHQGGDYISEALVFTNALTEAQRLDVQRYLMRKWSLPRNRFTDVDENPLELQIPKPVGTVGVAASATVAVDVAADAETPPLAFNGEGTATKRGAGTLVVGADSSGKPDSSSMTIEAGAIISRQGGRLPALALAGGSRYTAEAWNPEAATIAESSAKGGLRLTRTTVGDATLVVKDGDGWARANAVDGGVRLVDVRSGVLQLEAKCVEPAYVDGGVVTGIIENADFEMPFDEQEGKGWSQSLHYSTINGWAGRGAGWYMTRGGWAWNAYGVNADNYGPADGNAVLHAASVQKLATAITLPADGIYELSFMARNRCGIVRNSSPDIVQRFEICLGTGITDENMQRFASFAVNDGPMQRVRVRLPFLHAGTRTLIFRAQDDAEVPSGLTLDDMRLSLVGEREREASFAIPNGSFEYQPTLETDTPPYHYTYYRAETPVEGWAFTDGVGNPLSGEHPLSGAAGLSTFMNNGSSWRPTPLFNYWDRPLGAGALAFSGNGGRASTAFQAPAGNYRLRAGLSRCAHWANGTSLGEAGLISAKIVFSDGNAIDLGSVTATSHLMANAIWPTPFSIQLDQPVTLVLRQTTSALTLVDDLAFVADDADTYGELVSDGGFDDTSYDWWKRPTTDISKVAYATEPLNAYGWTAMSGTHAARLSGPKAHYYQTVTVPCAGLYRLRVAARSRIDGGEWSQNPIRFTLAKSGGIVTNEIGRIDPMPLYRQFQGFEYLFRVDEPGDYIFSVRAVDHSTDDPLAKNRQSFVDDISITRIRETPATFTLPEDTYVRVAAGAQVRLDFTNSVNVARLRLGNRNIYGVADASTHPRYISGLGSFTVTKPQPGFVMQIR